MIIPVWRLRTIRKFNGKKSKKQPKNSERTTPKRVRIRTKYEYESRIAPPSLSRERRIKMEQTNTVTFRNNYVTFRNNYVTFRNNYVTSVIIMCYFFCRFVFYLTCIFGL